MLTSDTRPKEPTPRLTLCLNMDLKGSTASGLKLSTKKLDRFNLALVDQLGPHLRSVQLEHALVKFTGDGWLVMSDEQEDAPRLCCLALIMSRRFQDDISTETGFPRANVPAMRLALCWGRDLPVTLHGGARDFVGSSVRHAVRACQLCGNNEILIDEAVRGWVTHDFVTTRCDVDARLLRLPFTKMEEDLVLHSLEELRIESVHDLDAPIYYVNTLVTIGRSQEADHLANIISGHLLTEAVALKLNEDELLSRWNELLASSLDYHTARDVLADLKRSGLRADVSTYNALLEKADDLLSENRWLDLMTQEDIQPNRDTFEILLSKARNPAEVQKRLALMAERGHAPDVATLRVLFTKAEDYETALGWADLMRRSGVKFDRAAFEELVARSKDFETARQWLETMIAEGYEPSETAFIEVFSKGVIHVPADDLLRWYLGLRWHPTHPIKRAIAEYRKAGKIDDALRLALDYPHTDTALKTVRQHPDKALAYFRSVVDNDSEHPNGAYALGMALLETGDPRAALPWLKQAYRLAAPGTRKDELARYLSFYDRAITIA
jgi:tetratricopeptide (TPR) repeat protein